jgi:hypothetical protein
MGDGVDSAVGGFQPSAPGSELLTSNRYPWSWTTRLGPVRRGKAAWFFATGSESILNCIMLPKQQEKLNQFANELGIPPGSLPILGERDGYVFTAVNDGPTVLIAQKWRNPRGGYIVPALASYDEKVNPTNLDAALRARELFERQSRNSERKYGHLSPRIDTDWKCGDPACPCSGEPPQRRKERSVGSRG